MKIGDEYLNFVKLFRVVKQINDSTNTQTYLLTINSLIMNNNFTLDVVKKTYKFLFIDDSPTDNKYLSLLIRIKKLPIAPHFEYNAPKALDYLAACTPKDFPEAILIDINMPLMNGFEFVEAYLEQFEDKGSNTLLYITSSSIQAADREKAAQHPRIAAFIEKPFNLQQFKEKILPSLKGKKV